MDAHENYAMNDGFLAPLGTDAIEEFTPLSNTETSGSGPVTAQPPQANDVGDQLLSFSPVSDVVMTQCYHDKTAIDWGNAPRTASLLGEDRLMWQNIADAQPQETQLYVPLSNDTQHYGTVEKASVLMLSDCGSESRWEGNKVDSIDGVMSTQCYGYAIDAPIMSDTEVPSALAVPCVASKRFPRAALNVIPKGAPLEGTPQRQDPGKSVSRKRSRSARWTSFELQASDHTERTLFGDDQTRVLVAADTSVVGGNILVGVGPSTPRPRKSRASRGASAQVGELVPTRKDDIWTPPRRLRGKQSPLTAEKVPKSIFPLTSLTEQGVTATCRRRAGSAPLRHRSVAIRESEPSLRRSGSLDAYQRTQRSGDSIHARLVPVTQGGTPVSKRPSRLPVAQKGQTIVVKGDGWGEGTGSYPARVTHFDTFTFTIMALEGAPVPWTQSHVLRECCVV
uniref:Uncharacterized protein n=1 Tax=Noctiluca scintillans TaxID=2966 RepID=A0A7S1ANN9_NOCSC|mmetsp:Transcript_53710/g.143670  ORF Transcript_53710/g.143670 Transcript_53710/m.143670 type:complete len:451 (+) Transcript_53710:56-1408(+)